jgi:hypothetical protein
MLVKAGWFFHLPRALQHKGAMGRRGFQPKVYFIKGRPLPDRQILHLRIRLPGVILPKDGNNFLGRNIHELVFQNNENK